jgi:hypothetical protein
MDLSTPKKLRQVNVIRGSKCGETAMSTERSCL